MQQQLPESEPGLHVLGVIGQDAAIEPLGLVQPSHLRGEIGGDQTAVVLREPGAEPRGQPRGPHRLLVLAGTVRGHAEAVVGQTESGVGAGGEVVGVHGGRVVVGAEPPVPLQEGGECRQRTRARGGHSRQPLGGAAGPIRHQSPDELVRQREQLAATRARFGSAYLAIRVGAVPQGSCGAEAVLVRDEAAGDVQPRP